MGFKFLEHFGVENNNQKRSKALVLESKNAFNFG